MAATGMGAEPVYNFLFTLLLSLDCAGCAVLAVTDAAGAKTLNSHARHAQYW